MTTKPAVTPTPMPAFAPVERPDSLLLPGVGFASGSDCAVRCGKYSAAGVGFLRPDLLSTVRVADDLCAWAVYEVATTIGGDFVLDGMIARVESFAGAGAPHASPLGFALQSQPSYS